MTEAEADGAAVVEAAAAPVTQPARAKAKQKTPQQKTVLEEIFASTLIFVYCVMNSFPLLILTV